MAQVEHERLALLLAVVDDVDAGSDLPGDHGANRLAAGRSHRALVDRLAAQAPGVKARQLDRMRQAAGVGGQDALLAALNGSLL
jgi:hypothetical protein